MAVVEDKKKNFSVRGLIEVVVSSFEECLELLKLGEQNRSYAQTKMNHHSSRSHTLYRLHIDLKGEQNCSAVLNFVDLAGSEKASIHENQRASRQTLPTFTDKVKNG